MKKIVILSAIFMGPIVFGTVRPTIGISMSVVTVTAYHPGPGGGCSSPTGTTASGSKVREGIMAVSRDVEHTMSLQFGDNVILEGLGQFEFQDRMASYCRKKADVFMSCGQKARAFGVRRNVLLVKIFPTSPDHLRRSM
jgi:3D (Asp-Asp-Asp) domain-containing protein